MPTKLRSLTTIEAKEKMPPLHPGEMLREEFMRPPGISSNARDKTGALKYQATA